MKKIINLLLFLIAIITLSYCTGKKEANSYTLEGKVYSSKFDGKLVLVKFFDMNNLKGDATRTDSAKVTDGKFSLKGKLDSSSLVELDIDKGQYMLLLDKGKMSISLDSIGSFNNEVVNGISFKDGPSVNNEYSKYVNTVFDGNFKSQEKYKELTNSGVSRDSIEVVMTKYSEDLEKDILSKLESFIKGNINNKLGQFMLLRSAGGVFKENKKVEELLSLIKDESFKNSTGVQNIRKYLETTANVELGKNYIDFQGTTPDGKTIKISDYVGKSKLLLIDFWASWCGPCMQELPNVIKTYKEFNKKGLQIIGFSLDSSKDAWVSAINKNKMSWPQISELKGWESSPIQLYAIKGIPHTVLLDKTGKIIAKDIRGEELGKTIKENLK